MTDLRIRITESDGIRYATGVNPYASTLYVGENIPEALDAILEGLQSFRDIPAMVRALHFCPEFCQLAAAVHGLHLAESDATPTTEAIAILTKLRDSRQPEAIRTRAGNLLIDIAEDDRAVCDASSVDYSKDYPEIGDFRRDCGTCAAYQDKGRERLHQCDDCETDAQQKWSPCEAVRNAKRDASEVAG